MSFLSVSVGRNARASGDMAVAVGDDAMAIGPDALAVATPLSLDEKMTIQQIEQVILLLSQVIGVHSALPGHEGHVAALQTAIRQLVWRARELSAIARHDTQRQAQSASTAAAAPDPQETPTPADDQSD